MTRETIGVTGRYLRTLFDAGVTAGLTDGQLLERFATHHGDAADLAFTALVERHGPMVLRACRVILRDDHEALDAFQATFLVLIRKGRSLWVRDSLGPWLHRVACRAAVRTNAESLRRKALERRAAERLAGRIDDCERGELAAVLHEELDSLPDRFRVPIVLCDLEGCTCEQAARNIGCPVGTVASRLARGRDRLRRRLARRGMVPPMVAIGLALSSETNGTCMPAALAHATLPAITGRASAAAASLATSLSRSMIMTKWTSIVASVLVTLAMAVGGAWGFRLHAQAPAPLIKPSETQKRVDPFRFMNDKDRLTDFRYVELGNMRPLIKDDRGVRFQFRQIVLYKDGSAKLWSADQKDPVAPPLRHIGPIRNLTFFDEANLLVTVSDESVKIWDALSGQLRKELPGQYVSPLWLSYARAGQRFVTIGSARTAVTIWDALSLKSIATLRLEKAPPVLEASLSGDGKTAVTFTFGKDQAAELWDVASSRSFAVLRPPSPAVAEIFADGGNQLNKPRLLPSAAEHSGRFWDLVQSLAPSEREGAAEPNAKQ